LHQVALELTERTGLSNHIQLYQGDILNLEHLPFANQQFDGWISLMVFLHIGDRSTLFHQCATLLKPGGRFYIEDYYQRQPLNPQESKILADQVACPRLPNQGQYWADLQQAGLRDIQFEDVTSLWQQWVQDRADRFLSQQTENLALHGPELVAGYTHFYQQVALLFTGCNLGGARIWGTAS
jgi:SAM-dependent methyltransferase